MPQLLTERSFKRQCWPARQASKLVGGTIEALLIDDLDPAYFGLRVRTPAPPEHDASYLYYDVWVLKDSEGEPEPGFLDLVIDTCPKSR